MRELRIGLIALTASFALVSTGCDDGDGGDAGPMGVDAAGTDAGPPGDAGPAPDAGPPTGSTCGPVGGECSINPGAPETECAPDMGMARGCLLQGGGGMPWMTECFVVGVVPEGGPCNPGAAGECGAGFQCFGEGMMGTCRRHCCSTNDCAAGDNCIALSMAGPDGMLAGSCQTPVDCDIESTMTDGSNGCAVGEACYPAMNALNCFMPGTLGVGEACMALNACSAGFGCYRTNGGDGFCRQHCDPTAMPSVCPMGTTCLALTGFTDVGFCNPDMMM